MQALATEKGFTVPKSMVDGVAGYLLKLVSRAKLLWIMACQTSHLSTALSESTGQAL